MGKLFGTRSGHEKTFQHPVFFFLSFYVKLKHLFSSNQKKNGTPVFQKLVFSVFGKRGVRV